MRLSILTMALLAGGCVQRTIKITSTPPGALVHLNDEEVGRTPLTVPFTFYGTYDVRMALDGYKNLWTKQKAKAPWWEAPGPDLLAEIFTKAHVRQEWHFDLETAPQVNDEEVVKRANELKEQLN